MVLICVAVHMAAFSTLLEGWTTISHDNLLWNYPVFVHYFGELSRGHLPIYNFFSRFGEPFVPDAAQMRFWDPVETVLGVSLFKIFGDQVQAFNIFRYVLGLLQCFGIYWCFRRYTHSVIVRFVLFANIFFGSIFYGSFQQDGILNQFLWIPFLVILLRRNFIEKPAGALSCVALGLLIGSSFQSYFFIIASLFLFLYLVFTFLSGERIESFGSGRGILFRCGIVLLTILPMTLINIVTVRESKGWVYPARTTPLSPAQNHMFDPERLAFAERHADSLQVKADRLGSVGSSSRLWDYMQIFSPYSNGEIFKAEKYKFGEPSEAIIAMSLLGIVLGFLGLAVFSGPTGMVWLNVLCTFFLLSLGAEANVYPLLVRLIPPMGYVRHTHCLVMYVEFAFMYFLVIGGDFFYKRVVERLGQLRA